MRHALAIAALVAGMGLSAANAHDMGRMDGLPGGAEVGGGHAPALAMSFFALASGSFSPL